MPAFGLHDEQEDFADEGVLLWEDSELDVGLLAGLDLEEGLDDLV